MLQLGKLDPSYRWAGLVRGEFPLLNAQPNNRCSDPSPEQQLFQQLQPYDCVFGKKPMQVAFLPN